MPKPSIELTEADANTILQILENLPVHGTLRESILLWNEVAKVQQLLAQKFQDDPPEKEGGTAE